MKLLVKGKYYDSSKVPVLLIFNEEEQQTFNGLERYVAVPNNYTKWQTQMLSELDLHLIEETGWQRFKRRFKEEVRPR